MKKIIKSDEEWKNELTPAQYEIARKKGTEAAFSGIYWDFFETGNYSFYKVFLTVNLFFVNINCTEIIFRRFLDEKSFVYLFDNLHCWPIVFNGLLERR